MVYAKKLLLVLTMATIATVFSVGWAFAESALLDSLDNGMVVELNDQQLNTVRAKGTTHYMESWLLPHYFDLQVHGSTLNRAQLVEIGNEVSSWWNPNDALIAYRLNKDTTRNEATFSINKTTGNLKIYNQSLVYWWPGNSSWRLSILNNRPNGAPQIGSIIAGVNQMNYPGNYTTFLKEIAVFWADGSYMTDWGQPLAANTIVPVEVVPRSVPVGMNFFIPNSQTPCIPFPNSGI